MYIHHRLPTGTTYSPSTTGRLAFVLNWRSGPCPRYLPKPGSRLCRAAGNSDPDPSGRILQHHRAGRDKHRCSRSGAFNPRSGGEQAGASLSCVCKWLAWFQSATEDCGPLSWTDLLPKNSSSAGLAYKTPQCTQILLPCHRYFQIRICTQRLRLGAFRSGTRASTSLPAPSSLLSEYFMEAACRSAPVEDLTNPRFDSCCKSADPGFFPAHHLLCGSRLGGVVQRVSQRRLCTQP
jgi:hypothetical protein